MGAVLVNVIGNVPAKERFAHGDYIAAGFRRQVNAAKGKNRGEASSDAE
jgi:hypothetical protein